MLAAVYVPEIILLVHALRIKSYIHTVHDPTSKSHLFEIFRITKYSFPINRTLEYR